MPGTVFYSHILLLLATSVETFWLSALLMGTDDEGRNNLLIWLSIQIFQISTEMNLLIKYLFLY